MAPFAHVSPDKPNWFTDGSYGVLYVAKAFETALFETIHHHTRFMARTAEAPGWTSQFQEIILAVSADLHDLRGVNSAGLFYPDCASDPIQGRHLGYHWDGARVDLVRDAGSGAVFRVMDLP